MTWKSSTITNYSDDNGPASAVADPLAPIHPGEILAEDFLKPMGISEYRLAKAMAVPARRINEIVHGRRAITADTALRLGKAFGMEAMFWLNLQARYDMDVAMDRSAGDIDQQVVPLIPIAAGPATANPAV